jgi:SNF2 family DNA or RNA helicase
VIPFWFDQPRNLLIYDSPTPDKVQAMIPETIRLHNGYVAVPSSLYNLQALKYLDHPIISPLEHYDWPGRFKPFEAQRVTANFLAVNPRALVLSDMGTGKTLAALWAADFVMTQNPGTKALIVAPLSILQRVWADAIFQTLLGRRTFCILHGTPRQRMDLLAEDHDFYIINFDGLAVGSPTGKSEGGRSLFAALEARHDIRIAIVDEASAYRDAGTRRHRVARRLLAPRDYLWLMTGTPTPNGPTDAYGMAKLVNNAFGESFTSFKERVLYKAGMWKWVPKPGAHAEALRLLQPSVRFAIDDCVDLPPSTTQQREVELSPEQAKAYKALKTDLILSVQGGKQITAANEAVLRLKLIQIACGAVYGVDREVHLVDCQPRLSALKEVLEQTEHKVIVFAPLTSVLNLLNRELKNYTRAVINGQVSMKERNQVFADFQSAKDPRILLADPGTMSHGLTLTEASTVVWYGPTDRTELYLQANARINRPGQVRNTTIVQIVSTPIEREIFRRLENNQTLQGVLLNLVREGTRGDC